MTYCIGIKTETGLVFASDSRTNAGLDNVNIYSKMLTHDVGDRTIVIVTSGNLGTSQAVYNSIKKDLKSLKKYDAVFINGTNINKKFLKKVPFICGLYSALHSIFSYFLWNINFTNFIYKHEFLSN